MGWVIWQMNDTERIENEDDTAEQELCGRNTCPYCGDWDFETDAAGNCANCGNTVEP